MNFSVGVNMYSENVTYFHQSISILPHPVARLGALLTSYWYLFLCNHRNVDANIAMVSDCAKRNLDRFVSS